MVGTLLADWQNGFTKSWRCRVRPDFAMRGRQNVASVGRDPSDADRRIFREKPHRNYWALELSINITRYGGTAHCLL